MELLGALSRVSAHSILSGAIALGTVAAIVFIIICRPRITIKRGDHE